MGWICAYCGKKDIPFGEMHTCNGVTFTVPGVYWAPPNNTDTNLNVIIEILSRIDRLLKRIEDSLQRIEHHVR